MLKVISLVVVVGIALLLIYAAAQPDTFRVERSLRMNAAPDKIFSMIDDLRRFNRWNPFEKKDPQIKGQYADRTVGPGAAYTWEGSKAGSGRMEIVGILPDQRVTMKLDFVKPFEAHNLVDFTLTPETEAGSDKSVTRVTWTISGPLPYISKLMSVFFSMDRMIGRDFEDGLNNLKTLAEAR